jgi:hypothetical protein
MTTTIDAIFAQYEKNKMATSGSPNKVSQEDRLKKYFTTVLDKGKRTGERRIRILPHITGGSPFVEAKFHEMQVDGTWLKLYDPAQEGKRSPLNEICDELMSTGKEEDRILARNYRSKKFYIVKVIDRDNEQDGVKFWRFKHNVKSEGVFDKIFPIFKNKGDISNPESGRDLILSLSLTKSGNGKEYTTINSIIPDDPTPLHTDEKTKKEWLTDELAWSDVYSIKGEDYLDLVARGEVPRWDDNLKKFVAFDGTSTGSANIGGTTSTPPLTVDPQLDEDPNDDLPF